MVKIMAFKITVGTKPDHPTCFGRKILIKTIQADNCLRSLHALFYHGGWQG
jgi:hypothetical protein